MSDGCFELSKKAKGISRAVQKRHLNFFDFHETVVENKLSKKVIVSSLKRKTFKIYLIQNRKKLLSRFSSKRLFSNKFRTQNSFFSFPLNFRAQRLID